MGNLVSKVRRILTLKRLGWTYFIAAVVNAIAAVVAALFGPLSGALRMYSEAMAAAGWAMLAICIYVLLRHVDWSISDEGEAGK